MRTYMLTSSVPAANELHLLTTGTYNANLEKRDGKWTITRWCIEADAPLAPRKMPEGFTEDEFKWIPDPSPAMPGTGPVALPVKGQVTLKDHPFSMGALYENSLPPTFILTDAIRSPRRSREQRYSFPTRSMRISASFFGHPPISRPPAIAASLSTSRPGLQGRQGAVPGAPEGHGIEFYGNDPRRSPDYGRMVSDRHYARIAGLLESGEVYCFGQHDSKDRYVAPTILLNTPPDSPVMQEKIFGPILPVLEVSSVEEVIQYVHARPELYVFAEDLDSAEQILGATESGDAAVNDCTIHSLEPPFGGVGNYCMGKYHGEWDFRAYTNARGVLYHSTTADPASDTRHTLRSRRHRRAGGRRVPH